MLQVPISCSAMPNVHFSDYLLALVIFAGAVAARLLLDWVVPDRLPCITFFPAVFLAAYYLCRGPTIVVLVLSEFAGNTWVDPTGRSAFTLYAVSSILFLGVASIIVIFVDQLRTAQERYLGASRARGIGSFPDREQSAQSTCRRGSRRGRPLRRVKCSHCSLSYASPLREAKLEEGFPPAMMSQPRCQSS